MSTLNITTSVNLVDDGRQLTLLPTAAALTMGSKFQSDRMTAPFAGAIAIPLGEVTTPTVGNFYNADATNYLDILNGATVIAHIRPGRTSQIDLPTGVVLNVLANTADCLMDYALFEEAP